jgi:hypothetical protein
MMIFYIKTFQKKYIIQQLFKEDGDLFFEKDMFKRVSFLLARRAVF